MCVAGEISFYRFERKGTERRENQRSLTFCKKKTDKNIKLQKTIVAFQNVVAFTKQTLIVLDYQRETYYQLITLKNTSL